MAVPTMTSPWASRWNRATMATWVRGHVGLVWSRWAPFSSARDPTATQAGSRDQTGGLCDQQLFGVGKVVAGSRVARWRASSIAWATRSAQQPTRAAPWATVVEPGQTGPGPGLGRRPVAVAWAQAVIEACPSSRNAPASWAWPSSNAMSASTRRRCRSKANNRCHHPAIHRPKIASITAIEQCTPGEMHSGPVGPWHPEAARRHRVFSGRRGVSPTLEMGGRRWVLIVGPF